MGAPPTRCLMAIKLDMGRRMIVYNGLSYLR